MAVDREGYAAAGQESRHNLAYWQYRDYLGIGPGAHGRFVQDGTRHASENHRAPKEWLAAVAQNGHGRSLKETLDTETAQREALLMGLRLTTGIDKAAWLEKFGQVLDAFLPQARVLVLAQDGFLENTAATLHATAKGRQRLDAVLAYLVKA